MRASSLSAVRLTTLRLAARLSWVVNDSRNWIVA
jgi:hypothetical protein